MVQTHMDFLSRPLDIKDQIVPKSLVVKQRMVPVAGTATIKTVKTYIQARFTVLDFKLDLRVKRFTN